MARTQSDRLPGRINVEIEDPKGSKMRHILISRGFSFGLGAIFHPLQCVKVLIQLGHEPVALKHSKGLFSSRYEYWLPNGITYANHLRKTKGFTALFTGVGPSLAGNIVGGVAAIAVSDYIDDVYPLEEAPSPDSEDYYKYFMKKCFRETVVRSCGIVASYPLRVVMIRKIAQIIGGEEIYTNVPSSISEIVHSEGFSGLMRGVTPLLLQEILTFWASSTCILVFDRLWSTYGPAEETAEETGDGDKLAVDKAKLKNLAHYAIAYTVSGFFYPFGLVSTVMAVNGRELRAGSLPTIPIFATWQDCWHYLDARKQLKRGAKLVFRSYVGPTTVRNGHEYADLSHKALTTRKSY